MRRPPRWRRSSTRSIPTTATSSCRDPGTITVLDDGRTRFTPAADGKHRYVIVDPAQKERITTLVHRHGLRRAGAAARTRTRGTGMRRQPFAVGVAASALILAVAIKSSGQAPPAGCEAAGVGRRLRLRRAAPVSRRRRRSLPRRSRQRARRRRSPAERRGVHARPPRRCSKRPAASVTTPPTSPAGST